MEPRDYVISMTLDGSDPYRTFNIMKYCLDNNINNIRHYVEIARSLDLSINEIPYFINKKIELNHISFEN